jgi:hypothetical protein
MWYLIFVAAIASVPLAGHTAESRGRSVKLWVWMAAIAGTLALPILLLIDKRAATRLWQA